MMDFKALLEKYQALLAENAALKQEILSLKARLGIVAPMQPCGAIAPHEKIRLFMSLFKGREDAYARRWESRQGRSGYAPVCLHEWLPDLCRKPMVKCAICPNRSLARLEETVVEAHLKGSIVVGLYPLLSDETCHFLAMDFDDDGWREDITTLREVCSTAGIPVSIERSRSGNGAHAWFFFTDPVPAVLARKFGTALLTSSMVRRYEITFRSYDRFFPNQDTLPKGGFGNLIALPLQKMARENGNSVFIDEDFHPYEDQWSFLAGIKKISPDELETMARNLCHGKELGDLKQDDEDGDKPWEKKHSTWSKDDFPPTVIVIRANMLYIRKEGITQKGLNALKRLAAFKNPDFYKTQAMRLPTYDKPRIIACSDETPEYICLPRGCDADIASSLYEAGVGVSWSEKTNTGRPIQVIFKGVLREEQQLALNAMLDHDQGVLAAATAFGKTVIAAKLIAERRTNTLILTHRRQLLSQWTSRLSEFLIIDEALPPDERKRGRKRQPSLIGQIGAGKDRPSGIIDVALMQSLARSIDIKDRIRSYGMVIVDECHHVPAWSFEQVLKQAHAKYVYGLTATPIRQDGHHPIIFMQCGPVRYRVDAGKQAATRSFDLFIIPRFTNLRIPPKEDGETPSIQEVYSYLSQDEIRNHLIIKDVIENHQHGRNALILTERTAHVESLAKLLGEKIPDTITLVGGRSVKDTCAALARIAALPTNRPLTLIATGKYIGEGFDEPRLDTLFLAMPIAWKGTLQQYAGRLHRPFEHKSEVRIYDYVDNRVRMLEKMYHKRLTGYASMGYSVKTDDLSPESTDIIFDHQNFFPVFRNDVFNATREIVIVSPYVTKRRTMWMIELIQAARGRMVVVTIVTRPASDYRDKDRPGIAELLDLLRKSDANLVLKLNFHQKFAVIDQCIVWYGSINLLSFGSAEESMMRLVSPSIAYELIETIMA